MVRLIFNDIIEQSWDRLPSKAVRSDGLVIHVEHEYRSYGKAHVESKGIFWDEKEDVSLTELQSVSYAADPTIINGRPILVATVVNVSVDEAKQLRIRQIKKEALDRISAINPEVGSQGMVDLIVGLWTSIKPNARDTLDPDLQSIASIRSIAKNAVQTVNSYATFVEVEAYDPTNSPGWP